MVDFEKMIEILYSESVTCLFDIVVGLGTPYTLTPTPYTLHPTPYFTPYTLNPNPLTPHPTP